MSSARSRAPLLAVAAFALAAATASIAGRVGAQGERRRSHDDLARHTPRSVAPATSARPRAPRVTRPRTPAGRPPITAP
ncbi:hypothetical protein [Nannocystis pusilla]|uniref:hypothetical protein n=1 Tax=Nannocystis pusilla TaxID=889268 RepID=UPI003B7D866E